MRIVFAGTPEVAVPSLRALVGDGHEVLGVITREDAPLGRKRVLAPSPTALAAEELGVPVFKANRLGDEAAAWVAELGAELGVIVAYGGLVREPLLSLPRLGWINLHFSELPRWRGAAPVQRALMAGEQRLGLAVFRLVEELDAGEVLSRDSGEFPLGTTAGEALVDLADAGSATLSRAILELERDPAAGEPQRGEVSYAHKLSRDDGRLDLGRPVSEVLAHWAGATPEPGAFVLHGGEPLKLHAVGRAEDPSGIPHGSVALVGNRAVLALTGGVLELRRVQPAGKPVMDGAAWLRGRGGEAVLG